MHLDNRADPLICIEEIQDGQICNTNVYVQRHWIYFVINIQLILFQIVTAEKMIENSPSQDVNQKAELAQSSLSLQSNGSREKLQVSPLNVRPKKSLGVLY